MFHVKVVDINQTYILHQIHFLYFEPLLIKKLSSISNKFGKVMASFINSAGRTNL